MKYIILLLICTSFGCLGVVHHQFNVDNKPNPVAQKKLSIRNPKLLIVDKPGEVECKVGDVVQLKLPKVVLNQVTTIDLSWKRFDSDDPFNFAIIGGVMDDKVDGVVTPIMFLWIMEEGESVMDIWVRLNDEKDKKHNECRYTIKVKE